MEFSALLNELATLSRSLSSRGIETQTCHEWVKPFKQGKALVAELGTDGLIARVSHLSSEEVARLRNIAPDNQKAFPGFNLNCPLLALDDGSLWNQPEILWKLALETGGNCPLAYGEKDLGRLQRLIRDFPQKEIAPRLAGGGPVLASTMAVLQRLVSVACPVEHLVRSLTVEIIGSAENGRIPRDLALAVLFGKPNKKTSTLENWRITLIFDVADTDKFSHRVADPAVATEWSALLLKSGAVKPSIDRRLICSLSGQPDTRIGDKMPNPNLPLLGLTYLMSMNSDTPCQTRYRKTSTDIFPVGKDTIQKLSDALRFIIDPSRIKKTWSGVPNGSRKKPDLLITYLEEEPDSEIPIVGLFGDASPNPALELATYEARTAPIYSALRLLKERRTDVHLRVMALSEIDKGRKQVVFNGRYSADNILDGRDRWLRGALNVPLISVPLSAGKGKRVEWCSGYQPGLHEAMLSFKNQWIRAGSESYNVPGVDLGRVYHLFLEPDAKAQSAWLLERYVGLTAPLLIGLGQPFANGKDRKRSLSYAARKEALIVIALYGVLLLRQDHLKEVYMETRDYQLGQFLQMADLLHKLYCKHERKNSIPPQLIGNAAISMAMQSPRRALEVLPARMAVYLAWADRFRGEEEDLVKWVRKELGRVSALLKDQNLETGVTSPGKAKLLLGYLANFKESNKQEKVSV
jgi:hypothetical protein